MCPCYGCYAKSYSECVKGFGHSHDNLYVPELDQRCRPHLKQTNDYSWRVDETYVIVEQNHRCVKRQFRAAMDYGTYPTAWRTIRGIEADHMIRKGQIEGVGKSDIVVENSSFTDCLV